MKLPSSQYRGVVAQQSGKWGSQIYKNDDRIWLGTYSTEVEAAKTYDLAALCLNGTNAVTNFNPFSKFNKDTEAELKFLKSHTTTDILNMLRGHTYHEELKRSRKSSQIEHSQSSNNNDCKVISSENGTRELVFSKVVSPGDIGPQNRLLIPRQHGKKYFFPLGSSNSAGCRGVMISLEDESGKIWRFRYAYWSSSGNHVLNGGWAQFAREKNLRAGDVVRFWQVTNKFGEVNLIIECDASKSSIVTSSPPDFPVIQPNEKIRLFGVNVCVSSK